MFPKLFPNGKGDPTKKDRLQEVSETLAIKHLIKVVTKSANTDQLYYPYAQHPRFKFWFYDRLRRHRSLKQCKVFMKHNPQEANLSIKELKQLISNGDSLIFMKKLSSYSSNITGSDAYWHKRRSELEATFEQMLPATAFFTFSYPDVHWDDLHKLMPGLAATTSGQKYKNMLNNPHLVDWFFSFKLNEFLKVVFDHCSFKGS